ncbi:MAG: LysR family transcriptional regulator [Pseudomonadota bacterium]
MVQDLRTLGLPALLSFHTVARLGGISVAAERLGLAKSGVSRHVAQLEAHFGVRLLERGARSVKLTTVGARLDQRVRSILAEVDLLRDIVDEESDTLSGNVSVAATPEFGQVIATRFFPEVRAQHPGLTLSMRPAYEFEDMQDPGTDIAFRIGTFKDDRLVALELGAFCSVVVASPEIAQRYPVSAPEDLSDAPCLTFRGDRTYSTWTLYSGAAQADIEVSGAFGVRSFTILRELALAGHGYAILPEFILTEQLRKGALVRCLPKHTSRDFLVYLTYRPGARRVARLGATIAIAEAFVPRLLSENWHPSA